VIHVRHKLKPRRWRRRGFGETCSDQERLNCLHQQSAAEMPAASGFEPTLPNVNLSATSVGALPAPLFQGSISAPVLGGEVETGGSYIPNRWGTPQWSATASYRKKF
jgi:hypothetical protein